VPGKGVGGILALRPLGKIRGIARAHVKLPLVLPPCAQVGTDGGDVGELLLFHRCRQQGAALGLQLQRGAGAAVPPVVPFQRHDAAAGAQVCGFLAALRLTKACQQQCVRAEPVFRGAVDHSSIIQNFRRMFHRQCVVSLPKNAGYFPAEFVHETKRGGGCAAFCAVPLLRWTIRNGRRVCFGHAQRKNVFHSAVRRVCGRAELRFS